MKKSKFLQGPGTKRKRPPPPLPDMHISEEVKNEVAVFIQSHMNSLLSVSRDISLGKDSKLFLKVAACFWLISVVGSWTDFPTLGYSCLFIVLTFPALYEKFEDQIDRYLLMVYRELQRLYVRLDAEYLSKIRKLILEKKKLD